MDTNKLDAIIHDAVSCGDVIRDRALQHMLESAFPGLRKIMMLAGGKYGAWDWPIVEQSLMRLQIRGLIRGVKDSSGRFVDWKPVNPLDELAKVL